MTASSIQSLPTVSRLVAQTGEPQHRVLYAVRALGLKPVAMIGHCRVFTAEQAAAVVEALNRRPVRVGCAGGTD